MSAHSKLARRPKNTNATSSTLSGHVENEHEPLAAPVFWINHLLEVRGHKPTFVPTRRISQTCRLRVHVDCGGVLCGYHSKNEPAKAQPNRASVAVRSR